MKNYRELVLAGSLASVFTIAALTGCSYYDAKHARQTGRTVNQVQSDKATTTRVEDTLTRDPVYKYPEVKVQTYQGIVQLSGFVNTDEQKRNAEQICQSIPGVNRVVNEITIVPQNATPTGRGGADNNAQFNQGQGAQYNQGQPGFNQGNQSPTNAPGGYRQ